MTEMIRMVDSNRCAVTDLYLKANTSVTLAMLHVTAAISGERNNVERVFCEGNFQADVCFGVSLDYPNDTSEINFLSCWAANAITAGWKGGNGVSGNVLDVRCYGCDSRHNLIGWWMHGCTTTWQGGSVLSNAMADFYLDMPVSHPVLIEGVRSENSGRFWLVPNGVGGPCPVTIRSVVVLSYTGQYYTASGSTFVINPGVIDGIVVVHQSYLPITIQDFVARGPPSGQAVNYKFASAAGAAQTCFVKLNNVAGVTSGAGTLGHVNTSGNVLLTILGGARLDGSGGAYASEVGNYFAERITAADSVTIKVFPGVPTDAGFARPPPDGTLAVGGDGLYYRSGGAWIKTGP